MLNENMLLTGDYTEIIRQWRIEGDNLILTSQKENIHDDYINVLINIGDGHIASGSSDYTIKKYFYLYKVDCYNHKNKNIIMKKNS